MRSSSLVGATLVSLATAHGDHVRTGGAPTVPDDANWMTKHMAEEHHMDNWDASAFFILHDYNSDSLWQPDEILRTYGLMDDSNKHVTRSKRSEILDTLMKLLDSNSDNVVSKDEWLDFISSGQTLPDLGTGPGHHGDDEYEYEIHHWEKYHGDDTKLEDLTHPEDIEHFKKHEQMEDEQERLEEMERKAVIEDNIPLKFRRQG